MTARACEHCRRHAGYSDEISLPDDRPRNTMSAIPQPCTATTPMTRDTFLERALAKLPISTVEAAIADAVSEVAGRAYQVSIKRMDLEPTPGASLGDEYELTLRVRRADLSFGLGPSFGPKDSNASDRAQHAESARETDGSETSITGLTGRQLNSEWEVGARHALYHHEGRWYHQLRRFPGALFDYNGYLLFDTEEAFRHNSHLNITQDVHVPRGIASVPGYVRRRQTGEPAL